MKYQPPFQVPLASNPDPGLHNDDADAPYVNGDATIGIQGSIPPAESFEHTMREVVKVITGTGQTPNHLNLEQVLEGVAHMASKGQWYVDSGAADAYVLTTPFTADNIVMPKVTFDGMWLRWVPANDNTGASTATITGIGNKKVLLWDGSELSGGELIGGRPTETMFDPTADAGNGALMVPPWASAIKVGGVGEFFNVKVIEDAVRTQIDGPNITEYTSFSYTKQSATSDVFVMFVGYSFIPDGFNGPSWARIDIGGSDKVGAASNNTSSNARGATVLTGLYTGLAQGAHSIDIDYGRQDANSWRAIINFQNSDKSQVRDGIVSKLNIAEIEQS